MGGIMSAKKHCTKCTMTFNIGKPYQAKTQGEVDKVRCPECNLRFHHAQRSAKGTDQKCHVWTDDERGQLQNGAFPILHKDDQPSG